MRPFDLLTLTIVLCALAIVIVRPGPGGGDIVSDVMSSLKLRYPAASEQPLMTLDHQYRNALHHSLFDNDGSGRRESAGYATRHDPSQQRSSDIPGALSGNGNGGMAGNQGDPSKQWRFPDQSQPALLNYPAYTRTYSF